jgi:hypothetical protein
MDSLVLREIENQLSLDTDLLLQMLGASQTIGATPGTRRDGKVIIDNIKRKLRERVCADARIRTTYDTTSKPTTQLVAAVLDCIAGAVTGISPITVSVLLVKEGLGKLCQEPWSSGH